MAPNDTLKCVIKVVQKGHKNIEKQQKTIDLDPEPVGSLKEILYKKFPPPSDSPLLILILMNRGRVQGSEVGVSLGFGGSASQHLTLKPSTYGARI